MSLNVDMDAVLLIDAENAFSFINRKVMLHNLKFICPIIATYISIVMQLHQVYLLSVGERCFLVKGEHKMTQQLWEHMGTFYHNQIPV